MNGGGTGVGGTAVGGTEVAVTITGVGGTEVFITTTGVGGMDVLVGSTTTTPPEVGPGCTASWVVITGGVPLAGNLQPVVINASITSSTHVNRIFLFMVVSLSTQGKVPNDDILHHFDYRFSVI